MKTIRCWLLLALLLSARGASAQYTALWQDFNSFPSLNIWGGWSHNWSGIIPWRAEEPYLPGCLQLPGTNGINKVAYIVDCGLSNADNSNVLMKSPLLDFTGHTGMYLRYQTHFLEQTQNGNTEEGRIEISTDGGTSWTLLEKVHRNVWLGKYDTRYIDLAAYSGMDSIKIGFRYNDHGIVYCGWSVDNVKVYKPAQHDVMLVTATPDSVLGSYCVNGDSAAIGGTVYNAGIQPVTEFSVHYQLADGSGPVYSVHYANLNLASFDTMTFEHPKRFVQPGFDRKDLKVWLTMPLDTIYTNDTLPVSVRGAAFLPRKTVLLEEGGTNRYGLEPRAITYMRFLEQSDYPVALVAVHEGDPMQDSTYSDFLFNFRQHYTPYHFFDRRLDVEPDEVPVTFHRLRKYFGFAEIGLQPLKLWPDKLDFDVSIKPAVTLKGAYRLSLLLTEDDVHNSGADWAQVNLYSSGFYGPMGGFENRPNPIPADSMYYDWVARSLWQETNGAGCLPDSMAVNGVYSCRLRTAIRPGRDISKMKAIVALVRLSDSTVLNAAQVRLATLTIGEAAGAGPDFRLYPNPAGAGATLRFEPQSAAAAQISVTDITGRVLYSAAAERGAGNREMYISTQTWPSGMYLVTLEQAGKKSTRKLQVLH